jgi:hypothetical protein
VARSVTVSLGKKKRPAWMPAAMLSLVSQCIRDIHAILVLSDEHPRTRRDQRQRHFFRVGGWNPKNNRYHRLSLPDPICLDFPQFACLSFFRSSSKEKVYTMRSLATTAILRVSSFRPVRPKEQKSNEPGNH